MYTGQPTAECIAYFGTEYFIEDEASVIKKFSDITWREFKPVLMVLRLLQPSLVLWLF